MASRVLRMGRPGLVLAVALAGCSGGSESQTRAAPVSYDGAYQGTVRITGVASGADRSWCDATTRFSVQVADNAFSYSQPHPNMPKAGIATYGVVVARDGSFQGESNDTGLITGRIEGTSMSGSIDGIGCAYTFTAARS